MPPKQNQGCLYFAPGIWEDGTVGMGVVGRHDYEGDDIVGSGMYTRRQNVSTVRHLEWDSIVCFMVKGPAADATDAPQPSGLLCNPVMKVIRFLTFYCVMEHRRNDTDRGKPKY